MKTNYKSMTAFIVLLSMIALKLGAQLSGIYTINNTLLPSATNYTSFTAFAASINTAGVSGPVTVNVATGTGPYTEQVNFTQIAGTSATNSVTVNGNGNTLTFSSASSAAPHTLLLSGADYMFFNNLNVVGSGATYALVCHLYNQSNNNQFFNCTFTAPLLGTGSYQVPFSLSGSATTSQSSGDCGNNNVANTCTMSGGYYNTVIYGNFSAPLTTGNQIINCGIRDFYFYGIMSYYSTNSVIRGNTIERVNRTNLSTGYGIYVSTGCYSMLVENNRVQRLFDGNPAGGNTGYCIYLVSSSAQGQESTVRNNVVSNMTSTSGSIYGIYASSSSYYYIYHNTITFDDQTSTSGTNYGIYAGGAAGVVIKNNLVNITRAGNGTHYCLYYYNAGIISNNNVLYNNSLAGTNAIGYYNNVFPTLASWQSSTGWDGASASGNPLFTNPAGFNYTPTNPSINNVGVNVGVLTDITGFTRNAPAPDAGAYEFFNTPCSGTPGPNTVTVPAGTVCPGYAANVGLINTYTVNGLTYQWGSSTTTSLGPWTPIANATLASLSTPTLPISTWFTATITCPGFGSAQVVTANQVTVATVVINQVPYFEGFEGITTNNQLPNCSWASNNGPAINQTYITAQSQNRVPNTGSAFASFYYSPAGNDIMYTNGIQLYAGVTYSASMFYTTDYYTYQTWTLSIQVGPNQSMVNSTVVAVDNAASSPNYKKLSNTFTVGTSGIYYVAVKAVSNGVCCASYLTWDDLSINTPCHLVNNTPSITVSASSSTICSGQSVNLTALGGINSTYNWSNGATTANTSDSPAYTTNYNVVTTNTITNCSTTVVKNIVVKQSPQVGITMLHPLVCEGSAAQLNATGANSYTWSTGLNSSVLTVTPTGNTTYTVLGQSTNGCISTAVQAVNLTSLPVVTAMNVPSITCSGDNVTLTGSGATTYQWSANTFFAQGVSVVAAPMATTLYDVTGTDAATGCSAKTTVIQQVFICTGVKVYGSLNGLNVYPNPNAGVFTVELANGSSKTVEVTDMTGRLVLSNSTADDKINVNISNLANGVYYVKIKSNDATEITKIVKQ